MKKYLWVAAAAVTALQIYFVRELLAAEILFGIVFAIAAVLATVFYLVEKGSERGLDLAGSAARAVSPLFARGLRQIEGLSRKPFRRPRSESVQ